MTAYALPRRSPDIEALFTNVTGALKVVGSGADSDFTDRLLARLVTVGERGRNTPARVEACAHFENALARVLSTPPLHSIGRALSAIQPQLAWIRRPYTGEGAERFSRGHGNALILGPGGLEARADVWVGVTIMAPETDYPEHAHPPDELYLVLSEGEWRRDGGPWFSPGVGGVVRNRPAVSHAMRSGGTPLLALWVLLA